MSDTATVDTPTALGGVLATPPLERRKPTPQAHRGTIESVYVKTFEKSDAVALTVKLTSRDTGAEFEDDLFLPAGFAANPKINPKELSSEPPEGKKMSDQDKYAATIANHKYKDAKDEALRQRGGDATIQNYIWIATSAGRSLDPGDDFSDIESYAALLNKLCSGVDVIFTLAPEKEDPDSQFGPRLRVRRVLAESEVTDKLPKPYNASKNTGFARLWEQE